MWCSLQRAGSASGCLKVDFFHPWPCICLYRFHLFCISSPHSHKYCLGLGSALGLLHQTWLKSVAALKFCLRLVSRWNSLMMMMMMSILTEGNKDCFHCASCLTFFTCCAFVLKKLVNYVLWVNYLFANILLSCFLVIIGPVFHWPWVVCLTSVVDLAAVVLHLPWASHHWHCFDLEIMIAKRCTDLTVLSEPSSYVVWCIVASCVHLWPASPTVWTTSNTVDLPKRCRCSTKRCRLMATMSRLWLPEAPCMSASSVAIA